MKIVFIAPFGIRPKGTVPARMLPLAAELQRRGHRVTIVAPPYTNPEDSGKVEVIQGVTLRNIALGPLQGAAAAPWLAGRLWAATRAERPDRVHLFKPKGFGGLAAMIYKAWPFGARSPLFLDTDDWEGRGGMNEIQSYSPLEKRLFHFQETWLPPRAAGVTVASRTLQTQMWGIGLEPDKVLYLPNGVTAAPLGDGASVRARWNIPASAPVLLLYTRFFEFEPAKLHHVLGAVFRRVPAAYFLVVGKGRQNEEAKLIAAAHTHGFFGALRIAGWVEPPEIPNYLAAGDVAIYPFSDTLLNRAKCPAKLTELLLAERAVVADKVGQAVEYINPGLSGVLCDPDDWNAMVEQAAALLLDPTTRCALGQSGRRYLLAKFSWADLAEKLERFYRHIP